ncbi:MAG TPA: hypothetical protein VGG38_19705 [Acidimicrobiales bacterium]
MAQRRVLQSISVAVIGLALAIAPLTLAGASSKGKSHKHNTHHTTKKKNTKKKTTTTTSASSKGSNPGSALCKDLKAEESQSESLGGTIGAALESGNFATAKQEMLTAINQGLKEASPALSVLQSAPSNVQAAMKALIGFDGQLKSAIENSTSLATMESSFETLGTNPKIQADGTTVSSYVTAQCGSIVTTTTAAP